ncbi:FG-GAP repeat protein [Nitrosomonas sp. Nm84]|uniref:calcium-binding protein n=1 Tax=Nitrosomonas sp. Nm84 TaxID=200124 RepID=UPI000D757535|nr:FG-GAP repeat protein [Nitrosomonas sp. Nm84]PXW89876.1 FG-GAP repeat protein [Nitrosomonas sp. Nm84]
MAINSINLSSLDGSNGFRLDERITQTYGGLGSSVSAGDINGDGFDDVIVGAIGEGGYPYHFGASSSYVVFGKASGFDAVLDVSNLDGNNGFHLISGEYDLFPFRVNNAGDVNGDGFDDVIIGASNYSYSGADRISYVVFGRASGFDAELNLSTLDGDNGFRLIAAARDESASFTVSSAGDINGDGFDDVIVGAHGADTNGNYFGSGYVVFGKNSGFDATLELSTLNGSNGFRLDGTASFNLTGAVSSAGDVNDDGLDDLFVGAPSANHGTGSSFVVFGKVSGFAAALDLSSLDGSNGFRLDGAAELDLSGASVSDAGDVNGDGFGDLIIGAPRADSNGDRSGSSYVVFGKASDFSAMLNLSSLDGTNGFRLDGETTYDGAGISVSSAGDVNGDGFDDVIIGAPYADPDGNVRAGSSYVVFGKAGGFDATVDLSSLDSSSGFRLDGAAAVDYSGSPVSGAGDINGDGFDDLIVGAPDARINDRGLGAGYVIFGRSDFGGGGGSNVIAGTPGDDVLKGTLAADIFEAGDGNDRMTGRGGADVFHGGAGDDYIQVADLGFGSVDGGSGNDTLHLDGKDLNLDLANLGNKIHGIETICLYGKGDNTLTLTATNLLDLSDTTNTLRVNGNAGDHITIQDAGWVDGGPRGSGYYHVYTHDDAVLLVGQNVTVDFA